MFEACHRFKLERRQKFGFDTFPALLHAFKKDFESSGPLLYHLMSAIFSILLSPIFKLFCAPIRRDVIMLWKDHWGWGVLLFIDLFNKYLSTYWIWALG